MRMSRARRLLIGATALAVAASVLVPSSAQAATASVQTLYFSVTVEGGKTCTIIGDLYRPAGATAGQPVPAILGTNGWGLDKSSLASAGSYFAANGYAMLAYSGLGWGGSNCPISIDQPAIDGVAASQLVGFLGGAAGVAYTDAAMTQAAPLVDFVARDAVAHDGTSRANDPRVGMFGLSYGGAVQFAAASVDPRIDTLVPMITFNDLRYSVFPTTLPRAARWHPPPRGR
ncbi:MAG: hypothetical protein DI566_08275 [Microbacterium sp.]|nr:MAG: hypothetical protein DI566_08275 [Microbacterium sp.]